MWLSFLVSVSNPAELHVQDWTCVVQNSTHVWTDGSVQLAKYPWLTLAAFAVVAEDLSLIASGRVLHWRLSSYSAELWGGTGSICQRYPALGCAFGFAHDRTTIC